MSLRKILKSYKWDELIVNVHLDAAPVTAPVTHPGTAPGTHPVTGPGTHPGTAPETHQKIPIELALQVGDHARAESVQATTRGIFI